MFKARKLVLIISCILLVGCGKVETPEPEQPAISDRAALQEMDYGIIHGLGQFTGFKTSDGVCYVYPYYNIDKNVKVECLNVSCQNDIWYEILKSESHTLNDVEETPNGIQQIALGDKYYAMLPISDTQILLASTDTLTPDYTTLVLEHIE